MRWLNLGFVEFQPSEIAKFALILMFAHLIALYGERMKTFRYGFLPFFGILGLICVLVIAEKHVSATIIICLIAFIMMFVGGTKFRYFAVIGGSSEQVAKRQTELMDAGLADRVFFPGHIHPDELPHTLAAADILLSPRIAGGNTPLKLLDYLKTGRAIVACDNPANRLILDETNARLVAPDPDAFAAGIAALAADGPLRERLGAAGHRLYLSTYNYRRYRQRLCDAYRQLLGPVADVFRNPETIIDPPA